MRSNARGKILIRTGLLLIAVALALAAYNVADSVRAQQSSEQAVQALEEYLDASTSGAFAVGGAGGAEGVGGADGAGVAGSGAAGEASVPDYVLAPDMEMPTVSINGIDYVGILEIPDLGLKLPVVSQWSYADMRTAPCRYSGSAYRGDMIICGHDYASHFGRLLELSPGDAVTFTDMDGNAFVYNLVAMETLPADGVEALEGGSEDWDLTLFTCTWDGQSRVTLRFEAVE